MSEDPELERRLEAMFSSARPRNGFEDELWRRIDSRRPWYQRIGRQLRPAVRYAPALATLVVVALGATWLAGNLHGLGGSSSTTSAGAPAFGDKSSSLPPAFGVLPPLSKAAEHSLTAPQVGGPATGSANASAGGSFSGTLPSLPSTLPVYRYDEPSATARTAAGSSLKAQTGLTAAVTGSDAALSKEPQFAVSGPPLAGSQAGPAQAADAFLARHSLTPLFSFQVSVPSANQVVYGRLFDGPAGPIRQVRPDGTSAGTSVDLAGSEVSVRGPLDLPLATAAYPLRSAGEALAAVNVRQAAGGGATFDHAELVYVVVVSGGHGYYEPELLLTGPGEAALAPVIAPGWLGR
jgi:hypothetical protein